MARYVDIDSLGIGRKNRDVFNVPELADGWNSLYDLLEDAPTADVAEVKRGEWKKLDGEWREQSTNKPLIIHQCSCCGMYYQNAPYNYCPNCGAKMDGGKAE